MADVKRSSGKALLAALFALFAAATLGPTWLGRAQINRFSVAWARYWTPDLLVPTRDACSHAADVDALAEMTRYWARGRAYDPHEALHQGLLACLQGDPTEAVRAWMSGLQAAYSPDPLLLLNAAILQFPRGVTLDVANVEGVARYASRRSASSAQEGDAPSALAWQEMVFAYDPTLKNADRLASLYRKLGASEQILQLWERMKALHTEDDAVFWLAQARSLEQQKDWEAAMAAYRKAASLTEDIDDSYRAYLQAGLNGRRARLWEEAAQAYRQAVALNPEKMDGYLGLGETFRAAKAYDEAAQWFQRAADQFPEDYRPPYYLGLTARAQGRHEEALAYFDRSLALKPNNAGVLYHKAVTLDALQRRGEAMEALSQAVAHHANPPESWRKLLAKWQRYPDYAQDPDRWWERGQAAEKAKDWAQAAAIYHEGAGVALPPDDYRLLEREALMHRYLKEWDKAAVIYEDLIQRYPDKINAYLGRGEVARAQKQYEEAERWFLQAQDRFPEDYRPPYFLGVTAWGAKRYDQALTYLDQSLALKPDYVYAFYYKAQALKALQRPQEAIDALAQAIGLHPNPPQSWKEQLNQWKAP